MDTTIHKVVTPNSHISSKEGWMVVGGWLLLIGMLWSVFKPTVFPSPLEVVMSLPSLWEDGLGQEVISSLIVNIEALILSALIGLPISYLARVPLIAPVARGIAKMRFLSPAVFFLPLMFIANGAHEVKIMLLTMANLFFLVTTMNGVVLNIPEFRFDDARTLKMGEWVGIWYVVVRGTVGEALDAIRDNAAMGWSMLMFVEGAIRSEGGVGVMLLNQEKHVNFAEVYGIALVIILVGITQDWAISYLKKVMCPYAS